MEARQTIVMMDFVLLEMLILRIDLFCVLVLCLFSICYLQFIVDLMGVCFQGCVEGFGKVLLGEDFFSWAEKHVCGTGIAVAAWAQQGHFL